MLRLFVRLKMRVGEVRIKDTRSRSDFERLSLSLIGKDLSVEGDSQSLKSWDGRKRIHYETHRLKRPKFFVDRNSFIL